MAKFKFGSRPETFKHVVKWKDLEGASVELPVVFRTRTRKEFGAFFDEMIDSAKKARGGQDASDMTMSEVMEANAGSNAKYLLAALDSWGIDDELNEENAERFANEYPAGANAVMEAYKMACLDGRLGN